MKSALIGMLLGSATCWAAVSFDHTFGDHMVLQQGEAIPVRGEATGGGDVTLTFGGTNVKAKKSGKRWEAVLPAMKANANGESLTVQQGGDSAELKDVVVGEVWFASGQSNMLRRMDEMADKGTAIPASGNKDIRFFHAEPQVHTDNATYSAKQKDILNNNAMYVGKWAISAPETTPRMSAVAWYFAQELQKQLGVPVGIVHASLGGSEMMAWIPETVLKKKYHDCMSAKWLDSRYMSDWVRGRARKNIGGDLNMPHPYKPGYLFKTGVQDWVDFPMKGIIWYQGESDAEIQDMKQNYELLADLIGGWRAEFKKPDMPWIQVQLPRINDKTPLRAYWPEFREVQQQSQDNIPGVYTVATVDLGSTNSDVHPARKTEVGQRLAYVAAAKVYGKDVEYSGPQVASAKPAGSTLKVTFKHAKGLTTTNGSAPTGFEIAGSNGKFEDATATLKGDTVELTAPGVKKPVKVRYGWKVFFEPNLVNEAKLPAVPYAGMDKKSKKGKK